MDDFCVFVVLGVNELPRKLISVDESLQRSIAMPPNVRQAVLFSHGRWREHTGVTVEMTDLEGGTITLGKLTPNHKCLLWDCWEGAIRRGVSTLTVKMEGGSLGNEELQYASYDELQNSQKECTKGAAPLPVLEARGKRKRGQDVKETLNKDQENVCPNSCLSDRSTPRRRVRGASRGGHTRLVAQNDSPAHMCTPEKHKTRGKQARTQTQTEVSLGRPSSRWGQTLCPVDTQTAILIGGQGSRMQFCKDPMWKLCTEDMSWVAAETLAEGPTPEGRIGHTATFDPESKRIYVFGGSKNKKWFNDVHILDTQSWRWTMVEAQGKVPPLAYHSCSLFRGELFVFGGVFPRPHPEPDGCSDSLYIFNPVLAIWYQPIVNGDRPAPRSGHSACVLQGKIFMFGGWDTPVCFNDMHALDLGLMEFSAVRTSGTGPSPRSWHGCAVLSESKFLVHGGYNGNNALTDSFIFDTDTSCWTTVVNTQLSAVPRAGHSIITMVKPNTEAPTKDEEEQMSEVLPQILLVFGGGDNEGSFFSDLMTMMIDDLLD
ncbi:kelch repeat-containing protein isoform X1 [Paramormyrops kingsleyae]|uniref:kelch repeat-containing protein isoform X1 n=1 Tax=Paramormyrops kingsleyae TaxID=1676925 RepID=UPI000CD5EDE9|nr:uncharacterized protein LOC111834580 isoform X1 [Paramormyrops kingsleyae]